MASWLNIYSIDIDYIRIFFIFWFYCNLTCKRKGSSWFKDERSISYFYWFWWRITHIDIKTYLLNWKISGLFYEQLPNIFFLSFCKYWLFCLKFSWVITNLDINNTFHHGFYPLKLFFTTNDITTLHL